MDKKLIFNETEVVQTLVSLDLEMQTIENILQIEFAYEDGTYQSDFTFDGTNPDNEDQDVDFNVWRKRNEDGSFPESYPCVMMYLFEDDWDRCGDSEIQILDYVYPTDFIKSNTPTDRA